MRALGWQVYCRTIRRPVVARVYGRRIRLRPGSGSSSNFVYFGELFEYDQVRFAQQVLRTGDSVVDGGANVGAYTLLFSSLVGDGEIHSYEPVPHVAGWLRDNVEINGLNNVTVHEAALAARPGLVYFSQSNDVSNEQVRRPGADAVEIQAETLEEVLAGRAVMLAKLDLEGGELAALVGAGPHLAAGNPAMIMVELMEWQLRKQGASVREVTSLLRTAGYLLGLYDARTGVLTELPADPSARENNVVAVHQTSLDLLQDRGIELARV